MNDIEKSATMVSLEPLTSSLLRTLLYADLFQYPLKPDELAQRCDHAGIGKAEVRAQIKAMKERGFVQEKDDYVFLGDGEAKIPRRRKGNAIAEKRMKKAQRVSRFIGRFPFVRAVMLSGSLSKDYMEEDSDIDYFIVTQPGRLWVARTCLILFKKVFLLNSHKSFCVNYFVDTDHLEIEDQNLFTATEVVTLVPTYNYPLYEAFRRSNAWADKIYPNYGLRGDEVCSLPKKAWWSKLWEGILGGKMGEKIDNWCMRKTLTRWRTKFPDFSEEKFELALRSKKYVSKHHPSHFQDKVINRLSELTIQFEEAHGVKL